MRISPPPLRRAVTALARTSSASAGVAVPRLRRVGPAGAAVLCVLFGALLIVLLPVAGTACPSAARALLTRDVEPRSGTAPTLARSVVTADTSAIAEAQQAIDDHAREVSIASDALAAARTASEAADTALKAADDTTRLAAAVSSARTVLASARSDLAYDEDMLATEEIWKDDPYLSDLYDDAAADVAASEKAVTQAGRKLDTAQAALSAAYSRVKPKLDAAARATAARVAAETTLADAQDVSNSLQATLTLAEDERDRHEADNASAVARWTYDRDETAAEAAAENSLRASCRATGLDTLGVSGGLSLVALLLGAWNVVAARRR